MSRILVVLLLIAGLAACAEGGLVEDGGTNPDPDPGTGPALRCTAATASDPVLGTTFNVRFGDEVTIDSEPLIVGFEEFLDDNRCPTGAACPDGEAEVVIRVEEPPHGARDLTLASGPGVAEEQSYRRYTVRLEAVNPHPEAGHAATAAEDYCVRLTVTRN